jgi:hypothetical protein
MRKRKWYKVLPPFLALTFISFVTSCSQLPVTIEEQHASQKPTEFEVGPITFEPPVVMVGDSITITASVKNISDVPGTYTAALSVNGQQVDGKAIPLDPGSSREVSFQLSKSTAGSYELAIGNSSTVLTVNSWSPYTIQYDASEGALTGIYVSGDNGHIVRFTPPNNAFRIQKIRVAATVRILNTSDFDKNYVTVRIWDKDGNNQLWSQDFPWRLFQGWVEIEVPDVRVNDDFYVELVTHSIPSVYIPGTEIPSPGGNPIDFVDLGPRLAWTPMSGLGRIVIILFDYPKSYIDSPLNRPETRSGYSYMGKLIDPGQKRLEGINWLIRVDGEGAPGS